MNKTLKQRRSQIDPLPMEVVPSSLGPMLDYEPVHVSSSTFLSGLSQNIHRWFRLTPSFGPDLVRAMINEMGMKPTAHIHDPFSGAGTTAIESSLENYDNSCVEINPFLHFVNKVCLEWSLDGQHAAHILSQIATKYKSFRAVATLTNISDIGVEVPPIHNVSRWWRDDVLLDILCIKASINCVQEEKYKDFFRLSLAAVLVPDLTNVTLGRLQLHFIDKSKHSIDAWSVFNTHALIMIGDISALNARKLSSKTTLIHGDSTEESTYKNIPLIDAVITSPPYPNRYSYVWNTRPHLYMMDFVKEAKAASQIDRKTIGGTWGTATSELMKGTITPRTGVVKEALQGLDEKIRLKDNLMANYVVHYFNRLDQHISQVGRRLSDSGQMAYVVGNSWIKDEYVATDLILGRMMEGTLGMRLRKIHRFRRRHSGVDLYESIVYATR